MELKKNPESNLEKSKLSFILFGFVVAVGLCFLAFSWAVQSEKAIFQQVEQYEEEEEIVAITGTEPPSNLPEPESEVVIEEIEDKVYNNKIENEIQNFTTEINDTQKIEIVEIIENEEVEEEAPFVFVEKMPEFTGGVNALNSWVAEHIEYPTLAKELEIQGKVYVQFVVTNTGAVSDVKVMRGADKLLDDEAVRVVKSLPHFQPGEQGGKKVNVYYTLPINFKLKN